MSRLAQRDLDELAANVTTSRERVALSLGPVDGDDADYWQELSRWQDWSQWVTPLDERADTTPDWRQV